MVITWLKCVAGAHCDILGVGVIKDNKYQRGSCDEEYVVWRKRVGMVSVICQIRSTVNRHLYNSVGMTITMGLFL